MKSSAFPISPLTRRDFLRRSALAGTAALAFPYVGNVLGANGRINIACIGVGGKGNSDSSDAARNGGNIVAICDVDQKTLDKKGQQFPEAKKFNDYRKLLETMEKAKRKRFRLCSLLNGCFKKAHGAQFTAKAAYRFVLPGSL